MRGLAIVLIHAIFISVLATPVFASPETLTGQLIDLACYAQDKANTGNAHKNYGQVCAQACAREGFAVGLLTPAGKVYRVTGGLAANNNARLAPHMSHTVKVTGEISEKDGNLIIVAHDLEIIN
jgi:hypothetical protein